MNTHSSLEIKDLDTLVEISVNDLDRVLRGAESNTITIQDLDYIDSIPNFGAINIQLGRSLRPTSSVAAYQQYRRNTVVWGSLGAPRVPFSLWIPLVFNL